MVHTCTHDVCACYGPAISEHSAQHVVNDEDVQCGVLGGQQVTVYSCMMSEGEVSDSAGQ